MTELLDRIDIAKLLKVSPRTVDRLIANGDLPPAIRVGRQSKRWRCDVIEEWIKGGCQRWDEQATVV